MNSIQELLSDPSATCPYLKPSDELNLARLFAASQMQDGVYTVRFYRGDWFQYKDGWQKWEQQEFQNTLYRSTKRYLIEKTIQIARVNETAKVPAFGKAALGNVEVALKSEVSISKTGWIDGREGSYLSFSDNILDLGAFLQDRVIWHPQSPAYFDPCPLDYPLRYTEEEPTVFLAMLGEQLNQSEIDTLQEFFGYCLTPDTRFQKALKMEGPPRSGKGTIDRTARSMIGEQNCSSKTLKAFQSPHALEDLVGKTYLSLSDQRSSDKVSAEALERLLGIIGEDSQNINPKGKPHYSAKLNCKIFIASNITLNFQDDTGAALSRFLFLKTRKSFAGQEDPMLLDKILEQKNEIVWWALRGLRRLITSQRFTEPKNDLKQEFQRHNAPIKCFAADRCQLNGEVDKEILFSAFLDWCHENQVSELDRNIFFRRLYAAFGGVSSKQSKSGEARTNSVRGISLVY